jgi:hypothetical protein
MAKVPEKRHQPRLPETVRVALEVIADAQLRRFTLHGFELFMFQKGLRSVDARRAVDAMATRGWLVIDRPMISITDEGWMAATTGEGVPPRGRIRRTKPTKHRRLPKGLSP